MFQKSLFKGGISIPHSKNTEDCKTVKMKIPDKIVIPMVQHIGSPCEPTVKKGDEVKVGQIIGSSDKFVSALVHSSVSGIVTEVGPMVYAGGINVISVEIKPDGKQEMHESIKPLVVNNAKELVEAVRQSGLVGLGGAGFPAHVKLSPPADKKIDTLIINAAECEPYITSDYREIMENSDDIIEGLDIIKKMLGIENVIIGIEDNKPKAIKLLSEKIKDKSGVRVAKLKSSYPQGAEKMLIFAATGRKVPPGKLPSEVNVVVLNVNSVSFIAGYLRTGIPLIKKRITVDGSAVRAHGNYEVLIGTPLSEVFEFSGGFKKDPHKVLMGGPMMGIAQHSLETTVIKNTNAILAFDEKDAMVPLEYPCIRCGRCVSSCPMNLLPLNINLHSIKGNIDELKLYNPNDCIECGCCSYVCPSKRYLVQSMKLAKLQLKQAAEKGGK